jgi:hypothetical protein
MAHHRIEASDDNDGTDPDGKYFPTAKPDIGIWKQNREQCGPSTLPQGTHACKERP